MVSASYCRPDGASICTLTRQSTQVVLGAAVWWPPSEPRWSSRTPCALGASVRATASDVIGAISLCHRYAPICPELAPGESVVGRPSSIDCEIVHTSTRSPTWAAFKRVPATWRVRTAAIIAATASATSTSGSENPHVRPLVFSLSPLAGRRLGRANGLVHEHTTSPPASEALPQVRPPGLTEPRGPAITPLGHWRH